jgi:Na+-driven multidrug efflux pump
MLQIPLAYWLAEPMGFGPNGVFISLIVAESILTVLGVLVFRRGKWKTRDV